MSPPPVSTLKACRQACRHSTCRMGCLHDACAGLCCLKVQMLKLAMPELPAHARAQLICCVHL